MNRELIVRSLRVILIIHFSEFLLVLGTIFMIVSFFMHSIIVGVFFTGISLIVWGVVLLKAISKRGKG